MKKTTQNLKQTLRPLASMPPRQALWALGQIRQGISKESFPALVRTFRTVAPRNKDILAQKPRNYRDLAFRGPISPLSLGGEISWAAALLPFYASELTSHFGYLEGIQSAVSKGSFEQSLALVDDHIHKFGWSYWATDLKFALEHKVHGVQHVRNLAASLQVDASNRPSSLYATILTDRVDDGLPYDAFAAKCERSFDRFNPEWFRIYVKYRALGSVSDPKVAYPQLIATEMGSSFVDYYECLLDCVYVMCQDSNQDKLAVEAAKFLHSTANAGVSDYRIDKLLQALEENYVVRDVLAEPPEELLAIQKRLIDVEAKPAQVKPTEFYEQLCEKILAVGQHGLVASEESSDLLKVGVNFKSLPLGVSLAQKAFEGWTNTKAPVLDLSISLLSARPSRFHHLCFRDDILLARVREDVENNTIDRRERDLLRWVLGVVDGGSANLDECPRSLYSVWLCRYLYRLGRLDDAYKLCLAVDAIGPSWARRVSGLKIEIAKYQGDLKRAIEDAAGILVSDYRYAYQLPVAHIFFGQRWSEFRDIPPQIVGFVAHYANVASPDGNTRYIARMACRAFFKLRLEKGFDELWNSIQPEFSKAVLIAFLEDAWTDENFALIDDLKSVHDVRSDRIEVFQHLMRWNPTGEIDYSAYIRALTLDETLWRGLQHINETRIFVNEAAVSRWAEKELLADFERWKTLKAAGETGVIEDELIRNYLMNPSVENLIKTLPAEQATREVTLLFDVIDRLFSRFVSDPADGLESYLSLRIRHGTLRGTVLGPFEQENLLLTGEASELAFITRWGDSLQLPVGRIEEIASHLRQFSKRVVEEIRELVEEKVQIFSTSKPLGGFPGAFDPSYARIAAQVFSQDTSFAAFLSTCYRMFWGLLKPYRAAVGDYVAGTVNERLRDHCENLVAALSDDARHISLIAAIRTAATNVQNQCEVVAGWFIRENESTGQSYSVDEIIEIAKRATNNVYRNFDFQLDAHSSGTEELRLSSNGLAVIYDCLYVIFENAWKHSGLGEQLTDLALSVIYSSESRLLTISAKNRLSEWRAIQISRATLEALRERYGKSVPMDLVAKEGGSGFAKLARAVRLVDRTLCNSPLKFDVENGEWTVSVVIPLYERNGVFDAYQ